MTSCQFNAASIGTGNFVVASATAGHIAPIAGRAIDGKTYIYYSQSFDSIDHTNVLAWEAGSGIWVKSTNTLMRTTITANSNDDTSPVNFVTAPVVDLYESPSGRLELNQGEIGITAAASGEIGEEGHISTNINFTSSNVAQNVTSIPVPAGDFELMAVVNFGGAGATTSSNWGSIISSISTPLISGANSINGLSYGTRQPSGADINMLHTHIPWRVANAVPTTYYLHAIATFAVSTYGCTGILKYRRAR